MVGYCDLHLEQQKKKPKKSNTHPLTFPQRKIKNWASSIHATTPH
jgi:hypothetical protein